MVGLDLECLLVEGEGLGVVGVEGVEGAQGGEGVGVFGVEFGGGLGVVEGAVLVVECGGDHGGEGVGVGGFWIFGEEAGDLGLGFGELGLLVEGVDVFDLGEQAVVLGGGVWGRLLAHFLLI